MLKVLVKDGCSKRYTHHVSNMFTLRTLNYLDESRPPTIIRQGIPNGFPSTTRRTININASTLGGVDHLCFKTQTHCRKQFLRFLQTCESKWIQGQQLHFICVHTSKTKNESCGHSMLHRCPDTLNSWHSPGCFSQESEHHLFGAHCQEHPACGLTAERHCRWNEGSFCGRFYHLWGSV